jgi:hypothetical protein
VPLFLCKPRKKTHVGQALLTVKTQAPVDMVLYKGKSKDRQLYAPYKKTHTSTKSNRYSIAAKEPWLLVTSLSLARDNPGRTVNI